MRLMSVALVVLACSMFPDRAHAFCDEGEVRSCTVNGQPGTQTCGDNGLFGPCTPSVPPAPPVPAAPRVTERTADSLKVTWADPNMWSSATYRLQYLAYNGWTTLVTLSAPSQEFVHTGLQPDTRHCYQVEVTGTNGVRTSDWGCRYTTDGTGRKVSRLQMKFHTGTVDDAGTDDDVRVVLGDAWNAGANYTWVDYGRDDFEAGDAFPYDLNLRGIDLLSDITRIEILKVGTDGWCLADFQLLVDEDIAYEETFHHLPGGCRWLDHAPGHVPSYEVDFARIRARPEWQVHVPVDHLQMRAGELPGEIVVTRTISRDETEKRVEGMVGSLIHGTESHWGSEYNRGYVEADPGIFPGRLAVDLDLEVDIPGPDAELDIDFDLRYDAKCSPDQTAALLEVTTEYLQANVDFNWFTSFVAILVGPFVADCRQAECISVLENLIADAVEKEFEPLPLKSSSSTRDLVCLAARTIVHDDGQVDLEFRLIPRPPTTPPPQVPDLRATFDAASRAPSCGTDIGRSCDSGSLLQGRGMRSEAHAPNTIAASCAEASSSPRFPPEFAVEGIRVSTTDGSALEPGREVRIDAGVTALINPWYDEVDFFYTNDADHPNWIFIGTGVPSDNPDLLSVIYRLPEGPRQAVRVQMRQGGTSEPCSPAYGSDRDDLIFAVRSRLTSS